jgi:hypothetical protein
MVGINRRFTWVRADLDEVKSIKNELGGTVNDVILTVVTRALRKHMLSRGEQIDGLTLKAFVPVSVRGDEDRGSEKLGNQVAGMIAPLPVGCDDPMTCLAQISDAMSGLKKSGQAVGATTLTDLTGFAPPNLLDQAARVQIRQRFVNLVVTNVPGPQFPLRMADRELQGIFPLVPLGNNLNLGVAIVSYNGSVDFGLVGDFDALPDLEELGELFAEGLRDMAEAAGIKHRGTQGTSDAETAAEADVTELASRRSPSRFSRDEVEPPEQLVDERVSSEPELVESSGERGAEDSPGPQIQIQEPWSGYERMKVPEIRERLAGASRASAGLVEMYEKANKSRAQVIDAAEKAQRGQPIRT